MITGVTGQDGSYLSELLLEKGYAVHGIKRRSSSFNSGRVEHLYCDLHENSKVANFTMHYGDMTDLVGLTSLIKNVKPNEIYNLAAQSHVKVSFEMPIYTGEVDGIGVLNILEAVRLAGLEKYSRIYQASTSELYGLVQEVPQRETTPFYPRSPYAIAKLAGFWYMVNYREAYGIFACNGILFNHESPRRGETFVTRKVTMAVARIVAGKQNCLYLGNLDASRDWGHARDYVRCMWLMLQQEKADDYVVATGETHLVREFVEEAFAVLGQTIEWHGFGVDEVGTCKETGNIVVRVDPRYFRPTEVDLLIGDPGKAKSALGWDPLATSFKELVREMVDADVALLARTRSLN